MIIKETYKRNDGKTLYHTYSDANLMIRNKETNIIYADAVDIRDVEYEETDIVIEDISEEIDKAWSE